LHVDVRLVALVSAVELAALYQDDWLVQAEGDHYRLTQAWARSLRRMTPAPDGLIWQARRDRPGLCAVLFEDRANDGVSPGTEPRVVFDDEKDGGRHLAAILATHQSYIDAPAPGAPLTGGRCRRHPAAHAVLADLELPAGGFSTAERFPF